MFDVYTPRDTGSDRPAIATLVRASGQVQRKPAQSYLWMPASTETKFYLNDAIQTGPDAKATLRLSEGGRELEVGPDSMVIVTPRLFGDDAPKKVADVKHSAPVHVATTPTPAPIVQQTPSPPQAAPGRNAPREAPATKGRGGKVAKAAPTSPPVNENSYAPPATPPQPQVSTNPLSLDSPSYDEKINYSADGPPVRFLFSWEREPQVGRGGLSYRFEVTKAGDLSFAGRLKAIRLSENAVDSNRVGLPAGNYYWRVQVVDSSGQILRGSPVSKFSLRPYQRRETATRLENDAPMPAANPRSLSAPTHIKVHVD